MDEVDGDVKDALQLRQQLAKSSVKKYQAMQNAVCADGRARGLVRNGDYEALSMLYDSVSNVLSELIRTAFVAREGNKFAVVEC